jgi:chemotaxis protein CheD
MHIRGINRYGKKMQLIYAGDFYVSGEDELIGTLLGSCISVCFHDTVHHISGMNHFMLPGKIAQAEENQKKSAKYGITAINSLLDKMYSMGAEKHSIVAKLFGGGAVLDFENKKTLIPDNNIRLARVMLEIEDIPIIEEDTGGKYIRKVILDVQSGMVYLKKTLRSNFSDEEIDEFIPPDKR